MGTRRPDLVPPPRAASAGPAGVTTVELLSEQAIEDSRGRPWRLADFAIGGRATGFAYPSKQGNSRADLTDEPNLVLPQFGLTSWAAAVADYAPDGPAGPGITVLYPDQAHGTPWNGKVWLVVHGQANNTPMGELVARRAADGFSPLTYSNYYAGLLIDQGYAVIYTRRPGRDGVPATFEDGAVLEESLNDNAGVVLDFAQVGRAFLRQVLDAAPVATYYYGFSSGAIVGRCISYSGRNTAADGSRHFDGFVFDDAGGGLPLPLSLDEGDVLGDATEGGATFRPGREIFTTDEARGRFTKQIDLAHGLYTASHAWLPHVSFLELKRQHARLLRAQGLGRLNRLYEVSGVSHLPARRGSAPGTLDMGGLMVSVFTLLDEWVSYDVEPPETRSDDPGLGGGAIALPPVACPTGVRFAWGPWPSGAATQTGYRAYDGTSLEPVDSRGCLVDINGNGYRDTMPTVEEAWRRLGRLDPRQSLTPAVFVEAVTRAVASLVSSRLLSSPVADWYIREARRFPDLDW